MDTIASSNALCLNNFPIIGYKFPNSVTEYMFNSMNNINDFQFASILRHKEFLAYLTTNTIVKVEKRHFMLQNTQLQKYFHVVEEISSGEIYFTLAFKTFYGSSKPSFSFRNYFFS